MSKSQRFSLEGKVGIVTGAGSGNGRALAIGLAEAGAAVCAADINLQGAEETAESIRSAGGRAIAAAVNVADRASALALVDRTVGEFGRLDILVNNAGIINRDPLLELVEAEFDRVLDINLKGPLLCTQAAAPAMIRSGGGSIINIVSTITEMGAANMAAYAASKGGLKALTKAMAVELAPHKIRVNGISPGVTRTGINREQLARPEVVDRWLGRIPLGRIGSPEDHVGPAVLLASDASSWMTGEIIYVEGGFLSQH